MENHLFALTVLPLIPNLDYLFILFPLRFRPHAFATRPTLDIILQHEKIPILIGIFIFIPVYYLIWWSKMCKAWKICVVCDENA